MYEKGLSTLVGKRLSAITKPLAAIWHGQFAKLVRKRRPVVRGVPCRDAAINLTYACDLACIGCNRGCFIKPPIIPPMTTDRFGTFLEEICQNNIKPKRFRLIGGEPTLHPKFLEFARMAVEYSKRATSAVDVCVFSNQYSERSREQLRELRQQYPEVEIRESTSKREGSVDFNRSSYLFVSPQEIGITPCPHPCEAMEGAGICGFGVDQLGYTLCPGAGMKDSLLRLNSRATHLKQLLDKDFVTWQASVLCRQCGERMGYHHMPWVREQLLTLQRCNGTPMTKNYHDGLAALTAAGHRKIQAA